MSGRVWPRLVPPVGTPPTLGELLSFFRSHPADLTAADLDDLLGCGQRYAFNAGRSALSFLLENLRKMATDCDEIIVPAYTCYSVAAAAVRAGFRLTLCDIDPRNMSFDENQIDRLYPAPGTALLAASLLGIPARLPEIEVFCRQRNLFMIDDAAQALGAFVDGRPAGSFGQAGIFSTGRGKVISTWQGGILTVRDDSLIPAINDAYRNVEPEPRGRSGFVCAMLMFLKIFQHPGLFWLPASLPFLDIGTTVYDPDFTVTRMSSGRIRNLATALDRVRHLNRIRVRNAAVWQDMINDLPGIQAVGTTATGESIHLRFGLLLPNRESRDMAIGTLRRSGIMAGGMYPLDLGRLSPLKAHITNSDLQFPGARRLADCLLTLPTHGYVSDSDFRRTRDALHHISRRLS